MAIYDIDDTVGFGSRMDILATSTDVRFTPEGGH
jgi:hypothetical protein